MGMIVTSERPVRASGLFGMALAALLALNVGAQDAETPEASEAEDEAAVEEMTVVGTRLKVGDPTARVDFITAEDIAVSGLTSAEEVIRSIPQNFSSINRGTNLAIDGVLDTNLGALGLGVATANLRGLGSANTLVVINGRRLAGAAGQSEFFVNIRDMPVAAIERVEVYHDGGSSVYGSDALAGVINIVLKKDLRGARVSARVEDSNNGADQQRVALFAGWGWDAGSISGTVSFTESDSVRNDLTGYTTRDYRPRFGNEELYDFRSEYIARAGLVGTSRWGPFNMILPPGNDGRNAQPEDFRPATSDDYLDFVRSDAGGTREDVSVTLYGIHTFFDKLTLYTDILWTQADTSSRVGTLSGGLAIMVPASNAFNNFGRDVWVAYTPQVEVENGLIPEAFQTSRTEQLRYVAGVDYALTPEIDLKASYSRSQSNAEGVQFNFGTRVDPFGRPNPDHDARIAALLASDDPSVAVNLFGDGSGQNPTVAELLIPVGSRYDTTVYDSFEAHATGNLGALFRLPGGPLGFVVGVERRKEWLEDDGDNQQFLGVPRPTRDLDAAFIELLIPIVGEDNARPALQSLTLIGQARWDSYEIEGAVGTEVPGDRDAAPNLVLAKFANVAPRIGVNWQPASDVTVRASWSESFRAPVFNDLFSTFNREKEHSNFVYDPLASPSPFVPALRTFGPNPDLKPEISSNINVGVQYRPRWGEGLEIKVDYSDIDYKDRISGTFELGNLLPPEEFGNLPQFFVRDEDGRLIESITRPVNISRRVSRTLDISVSKPFRSDLGDFTPRLHLHRVIEQCDQAIKGSECRAFVGELIGIDEYKLRGELKWAKAGWSANLLVHYTPSYIGNAFENSVFIDIPNTDVDSMTTVDFVASYVFDNGITVRGGGRNIFDREFPFVLSQGGRPFDAKRVDIRGRVLLLEASYEFGGW